MSIQPLNVQLPNKQRNYATFDQKKVDTVVARREQALPELKQVLKTSRDEKQIVETLYILDRMLEKNVKGIDKLYPELSRFNDTKSANIQTFLAGIYRKTQVPDGFGPLVSMLIKNSIESTPSKERKEIQHPPHFDPNEEIGGAILSYIENYAKIGVKKGLSEQKKETVPKLDLKA